MSSFNFLLLVAFAFLNDLTLQCDLLQSLKTLEIKDRLNKHLVGHWKMDEESGNYVDDDSGNELHGKATIASVDRGKYTRARYFNGANSPYIDIPNNPVMHFDNKSFSFAGWIKIEDYKYPLTTFAVRQGYGCYFQPGRKGFTPGWDIGHGFNANGTNVCIRDHLNNKKVALIMHDKESMNEKLLGKWTHYVVVFDRVVGKVFLHINGKKQIFTVDISNVKGAVNNDKNLRFGALYGWMTKGKIDDYRMYGTALNDDEVIAIYKNM